ncbi:hypothetical protein ACFY1U_43045 [Streptomyces sp. NPDC001351]|uniref:hypothetical protein n=1 Tax=Streptomyces sp. NPDC001351 TaxID=3364564 RepID=UPI0036918595
MAAAVSTRDELDTEVVGRRVVQYALDTLISTLIALPLAAFVAIGASSDSGSTAWAVLAALLCGLLTLFWWGPALIAMRLSLRYQRLGDVVAGTVVIRDRCAERAGGGATTALPGGPAGWTQSLRSSRRSRP